MESVRQHIRHRRAWRMMTTDILTAARQCLGTPFRHQGRQVGVGLDCAGVAIHVAQSIGAECFDVDGYGTVPANGELERALDAQPCLQQVELADRQAGDLLLMRFSAEPQHLAIFAGETIVHAYEAVGKCCEHRLSSAWGSRIVRVYRFQGVA